MIFCKTLNKEFASKKELFDALRTNKDSIIAAKKAEIYKSCEKGSSLVARPIDPLKLGTTVKNLDVDSDYYYIAVNSSRILDYHEDMHLDGNWNKTAKEQNGKVYLVDSHEVSIKTTIAKKEHIELITASIPFSMIGKRYEGDTYVLIYKIRKDKIIDQKAREWLDSGEEIEASVRMQYVDIVFALNSDAKEDVKEKKNFDDLYPTIANKEDFDTEILYFWGIKQAKNVIESSLVLFGSNPATGNITDQPSKDIGIEDTEPSKEDTHKQFYLNLHKQKK